MGDKYMADCATYPYRGYSEHQIQDNHFIPWDSLNAKRGYGWDTNPWVWVIEFERINKE
jgi:hypothetical protein